jgi:hypothetical protein
MTLHLFSQTFLTVFIYLSLLGTGLGGFILLALLVRDWKNKKLW